MCGIAGIVSVGGADPRLARRMIDRLRHRGPDHTAVEALPNAVLAAARLAIVDPIDEANQPMWDRSRRWCAVVNGEIYNFREIRDELEVAGAEFLTRSDTEVVLEAYKRWGPRCLDRFNGMFALAVWDCEEQLLFLARDRFGVKPLFTRFDGERFFFASEMKAILATGMAVEIDASVVGAVLRYEGADRGTLAMFRGIEALPPGSYALVKPGDRPQPILWWRIADHQINVPARRRDRVELFRETLLDAVRLRLRTDVSNAITLSSGLDSSMIYAAYHALRREGRAEQATLGGVSALTPFVVGYPGDPIDESAAAAELARLFGDVATIVTPRPEDTETLAREVVWHQETIPWNAAVLAYHSLYKSIAATGARVVLEGHGSDEMLAGYPQFTSLAYRHALRHGRLLRAWSYRRASAGARNVAADRVPAPPSPIFDRSMFNAAPSVNEVVRGVSPLRAAMLRAFESQVLPTILRIFDRASMAASVESRSPFLDWRLVALVFSLPESDIVRHGRTKWIQRAAARRWLPKTVTERRGKNGFAMPHPRWFRHPSVVRMLRDALSGGMIARTAGLDARAFERTLNDEVARGFTYSGATALWQAYAYALLVQTFTASAFGERSHPNPGTAATEGS
jgi:asparagine synthase (glutamine-hydrolysing)